MGVVKELQGTVVGAGFAYATIDLIERTGRKYGFKEAELSWVLETNRNTRTIIEPLTGPAYKTYGIYEKALCWPVAAVREIPSRPWPGLRINLSRRSPTSP